VTKRVKALKCLCGSGKDVEWHHLGGKNHVFWFCAPLCRGHHAELTAMLQRAGVEMRYTSDPDERMRRARLATYVFLWFLDGILAAKSDRLKRLVRDYK